ncbi:TonB-linked SusC/RagA family outer membrane protein [Chitinophaga niastensis]|uniref:TonB-linked SusC/RagA family outer membrane protein n=1 Tax=Chitinophaga niastensis TaxID=536980 RepID=A0A2P8HK15_CHINA|nr:SusC/RagA family TonB-linked outer membrane protein [Chitinophaga niastensis]PSL46545.1 TonB-linked SusC/RagA family outer membrane protein [Chitinophaga niastensis]
MKRSLGLPSVKRVMQGYAMRLLLLSLLLVSNIVVAQEPSVLDKKVSYQASKLPLTTVLKEIRSLTNVRFTYNTDLIRRQPAVTVSLKQGTLEELLKLILANTKLQFSVDMGGIVIYPDKPQPNTSDDLSIVVTGQVRSANDEPLEGATVQALSSKEGTVTLADGMFSLVVKEKEQLRVSLVGMKTVYVTAKKVTLLSIKMDTAAQVIQEVVVNGYQKIDARMSTAAVFKLTAAEILQPGASSVDKMLQGKVPGLMIINNSGGVNAKPTIRMRGTSTFVGNASPLWVIDGVVRPDPVDLSSTLLNNVVSDAQNGNYALIGNAVSGLNPYDVESITFLKDAAATAIYGVRAANGVIMVTTKKGKAGPMQVSYNTDLSFEARPSYNNLNLMNSKERVALSRQLAEDGTIYRNDNGFTERVSYEGLLQSLHAREITEDQFKTGVSKLETRNQDWFKLLFRNAMSMTHAISLSGGAGKTTYYASLSYADRKGAAKLDGLKRYTADISIHSELGKKLSVDVQLMGNYNKSQGYYSTVNPLSYALQTARIIDKDDFYPVKASGINIIKPLPAPLTFNMLNELAQTENSASTRSAMANISLTYKIASGWIFHNTTNAITDASDAMTAAYEQSYFIGIQRGWNYGVVPTDKMKNISQMANGGLATLINQNAVTVSTRNMVEYNTSFFKERDLFNFTAGNEISSAQSKGVSSTEPGYYPDRGQSFYANDLSRHYYSQHNITNTTTNTVSYFSTAAYSLNNKYVLSATIRTDGSNRFGQFSNSKFLPNYGLSAKWNAGNETWLQNSRQVSGLQFRASYGTQGNVVNAVGPNLIASYTGADAINQVTGEPSLTIKSLPYPDLRWEKTYQWNIGTDISFFERRVNLSVDYYAKKSVDLITNRIIPFEYGMNDMYKNAGTVLNRGWELALTIEAIRRKNTNLSFTFQNSKNYNQVAADEYSNAYPSYFTGGALTPGKPISGFYSYAYNGLNHNTGIPTFKNLDNQKSALDPTRFLVYSGQTQPLLHGSFASSFRYKSLSVTANFYYSVGASRRLNSLIVKNDYNGVPNPLANVSKDLIDRWRKPGDETTTNIPVVKELSPITDKIWIPYGLENQVTGLGVSPYVAYNQSDFRVVNSSFVRCNYLNFSYLIPPVLCKRAGVRSMTAGLSVNNLFTITSKKLKGQDPEIDGVGTTALPITRQYAMSLRVDF